MKLTLLRVFVALAFSAAAAWAELPAESVLPGQAPLAAELPPEWALPSYALAASRGGSDVGEGVESPQAAAAGEANESAPPAIASDAPELALPDERQLPVAAATRQQENEAEEEPLPVKGSPDGIPWLRLNRPGHTAPLRALAFSSDGSRLTTAGDDKSIIVWGRVPAAGGGTRWVYERTVRWQIQRGARGRIYALAAAPQRTALAGEGAMGGAGEVLLIDPASGEMTGVLNDLEQGHRQAVVALSFSPGEAKSLASLSIDGAVVHWTQTENGLWQATRLRGPDGSEVGNDPTLVERLLRGRALSAVAAVNDHVVIAPAYHTAANNRIAWRLDRYDVRAGRATPLGATAPGGLHWDYVTAMAVGADGRRLASADGAGHVYLWNLEETPPRPRTLPSQSQVVSLAFNSKGTTLIAGGAAAPGGRPAAIEIWDVTDFARPRRRATHQADKPVMACGVTADGRTAAWTSGPQVHVQAIGGGPTQVLVAGASPPLKVAFPATQPYYRLGFTKSATAERTSAIDHVFDAEMLRIERPNRNDGADWLPDDWLSRGWQIREEQDSQGATAAWFYDRQARRAQIPLMPIRDGALRTVCWIPSREPGAAPVAVAVGTSAGEIFLVKTSAAGVAPVLRRFRGHWAEISSLAVSADLRYLASSSLDGTIAFWPLAGLLADNDLIARWGADFRVDEGALTVADVRRNGPAYFRGLRDGDRIAELRYRTGAEDRALTDPHEMLAALRTADWRTLMTFRYVRGRGAAEAFQIVPAWQQLVSLFVADDGEWAYWAPAGYYDASFEGHKLFGWQINRGLEMLPDFFLAAQFRRQLERPGAMSRLLRAGNLEAAFQSAQLEQPVNSPEALVNSYRLKPAVRIIGPRDGDVVSGTVKLQALISTDAAEPLAEAKAFANGVVATERKLVSEEVVEGRRRYAYEWNLNLPSDQRLLVQVAASTRNEIAGGDQVVVMQPARGPRASRPRLFLLSAGVDGYRDAQIPRLTTAVQATEDLLAVLRRRTKRLYELDAVALVEQRATKPSWRALTDDVANELARRVSPDDLLVVFWSGHGVQAPGDAGYQFITADARYADVAAERYGDCLSMADLEAFADVPCRKLVILNTCHGGSAQPLLHRELKSAVRALQDDLVLTLAASRGEEEAVEGRFARRLMEALGGAADGDQDGAVSFVEIAAYVERTVAADSSRDAVRQTPSAGPQELLPFVSLTLTESEPAHLSAR